MTLMSVIVAFLFAISLWYLSSNHKVTFVKLKATDLKFLPNRSWHRLIPAGGTFVSAKGGTFQSDTPGTFVSAMRGTIDSAVPGTFESDTGGTFNPLLSAKSSSCISPESIRKELKVSRVELAKRSDLSVTALYNIENNISFPPKETIEKLCGSSHIPVSYLMLYSLTEDDVPDDKREFCKLAVGPVKAFLMGK